MNGPLKCGWGCGSRFYNADEQHAHEKTCTRRPAYGASTGGGDVDGALRAAESRSHAA